MAEDTLSQEGKQKVDRWKNARNAVDTAKSRLSSAQCELANATTELGKWLTPDDAKEGKTFAIWSHGALFQVTLVSGQRIAGDWRIEVRQREKSGREEGL